MALTGAGRDGLSDELPPRPPDRAAVFNERYFEELSSNMKRIRSSIPARARDEVFYFEGKKVFAKYLLGGQLVGRRQWNQNGVLEYDQAWREGRPFGTSRRWHDNGQLMWEAPSRNGLAHGICRQWDENGKLLGAVRMKMGTGVDLWWGDGPQFPTEERHYLKGERHGYERIRSRRNEVFQESHFHHDAEHGVFRQWNGQKLDRGYPKFYILGKKVNKRQYLTASKKDATLPPYLEKEDSPRRMPVEIPTL
jgi:antitoxin component YwqK of YwqJK toxin-antitoxin module